MHRRHRYLFIATVLLLLIGLGGYLVPGPEPGTPPRILLENAGGPVVFEHKRHYQDHSIPCQTCHHEDHADIGDSSSPSFAASARAWQESKDPVPCGSCHPVSFGEDFSKRHTGMFESEEACRRCHHVEFHGQKYDHDLHQEIAGGDCQVCHHGPDIEPSPTACADCHDSQASPGMPDLREAAHERCRQCHADLLDQGLQGCETCHETMDMKDRVMPYSDCSQCHEKPEADLLLTRTNAFHTQCMGCHMERGKGPYGEDDCYACHIR